MATATAASSSGSKSLKEYLKRYEDGNSAEEVQKKKTKKKKKKQKINSNLPSGVVVVDQDPVWQKPVKIEEEEEESPDEDKPVVNEDIEVKRMKRLEMLRMRRGYNAIAEDGSGWVTLSPKREPISDDISPPRRNRPRNDTPSPERGGKALESGRGDADLSPPQQSRGRHYSPSPEANDRVSDLSPLRKRRARNDTPSPEPGLKRSKDVTDLSPPRRRARYDTPSPKPRLKPQHNTASPEPNNDMSPLRRLHGRESEENNRMKSEALVSADISPPRRARRKSLDQEDIRASLGEDLSPPRKSRKNVARSRSPDLSKPLRHSTEDSSRHVSLDQDISPPRRNRKESTDLPATKGGPKTGLISGRDIREEISRKKRDELLRFEQLDPSVTGKGAEPVYRDKKGGRISKEEYLKSKQKVEEKPKEIKIEWGKGLAQKREAEAKLQELELEKDRPFAQTRDDPELDKMLKDRLRWGDPMAHLVKKKRPELVLADLGANEKMKESGFIVPQDIPSHSWLKRGLDATPNRYGIKPGRHWDGVDRSNGFEKQMFKRMNEKQATEREAYLWSVSDM